MKEIDFDELDRAVNSLMKTVPPDSTSKTSDQRTDEEETVLTIGSSSEVAEDDLMKELVPTATPDAEVISVNEEHAREPQPEPKEPETVAQATSETPSATPTPRRGRFMDMVRPTVRDAKRTTTSGLASRQGITLQPMGNPVDAREEVVSDTAVVEQADYTSEPDTSMFPQSFDALDAEIELPQVTDDAVAAEEAPAETATDDIAPLSSPFLPDAKVEKRPLGRPADAAPVIDLAAELNENTETTVESQSVLPEDVISPNKDAQLPEQPLPAELGSELLSIETSTDNLPPEPQPEAVTPVLVTPNPTTTSSARLAPEPVRPIEMTSIPQQYKVQPQSTEAAPVGTIYDTQPLAHPAEKKPGWMWILAILAILIIGAGFGAAVYYLNLL